MTAIPAIPAKIDDGSWGVSIRADGYTRSIAQGFVGRVVRVTTRAGKSWLAEVTSVVRVTSTYVVCRTKSAGRAPRARRHTSRTSRTGYARTPRTSYAGRHTDEPCDCGNWSGAGSMCLH